MSTPTLIVEALRDILLTVTDVDEGSTDDYQPAIRSTKIALVIPPFSQMTRTELFTRDTVKVSHRFRCEFWVRLTATNRPDAIERAREVGYRASRTLMANPDLGGNTVIVGSFGDDNSVLQVTSDVDEAPREIGNAAYIVCTMFVNVIDYTNE